MQAEVMQTDCAITGDGDVPVLIVRARRLLEQAGIPPDERGRLVTVCAELGQNIAKYAYFGTVRVLVEPVPYGLRVCITAEDSGPGIADVDAALRDHYSSGGSLGLGLPGVARMMNDLRIETRPGVGTTIHAERRVAHRGGRR
jgi:anti-sigma regulatory factor (Ser/Thr protein kinase)